MNKNTKEFREKIAAAFIKSLEENPFAWKKEWQGLSSAPINGSKGRKYNGLNRFWLQHQIFENGWQDPRFYTFKQVSDMGLKVKSGSKAVKVEFWSFYDPESKKKLTYKEAEAKRWEGEDVVVVARYYSVFNGDQIEGLKPYEQEKMSEAKQSEAINLLAKGMKVEILHDGGDEAFYRPSEDKIHLPLPESFFSQEAYNATALHELAHASGAEHRLNRRKGITFGDPEYAKEELVAEISSCFTASELGLDGDKQLENHTAYIRNWVEEIKEKPEALMAAIKEADKATDFMISCLDAEYIRQRERKREIEEEFEM